VSGGHRELALVCGVLAVLALTALGGAAAAADPIKERCVDSNTRAQSLRRQGRFVQARDALRTCGDAACPSLVRDDCAERLDALNRAQPTMILDVKDSDGNDLASVKVTVDGRVVADPLGGTPVSIDPGEHSFLVESPGHSPLTRTFVLKEGEKDRRERILLAPIPAPASPPPASPDIHGESRPVTAEPAGDRSLERHPGEARVDTQKMVAFVAGGIGVASLVTGIVLGLGASSAYRDQQRDCASSVDCPNHARALSDHSAMETEGRWSTIAFVAGGALLAGGAWLFFTDRGTARPKTAGLAVAPAVGRTGTGLLVRGEF
jgi:hypothetical protein